MSLSFQVVTVDGELWYELTAPLVCLETGIAGYWYKSAVIHLELDGCLTLSTGFRWDGRSGPALDTANTLRSSAVHDALYELIILEAIPYSERWAADVLKRKLDKEDGVGWFRRWYSHIGLRLFGRGKSKRDYLTARQKG
jgi:hypothetical protein